MSESAIKIENLWKQYRLGRSRSTSFRESVTQFFSRREEDFFWALKEIDFNVKQGDALGIIGRNGAGKSTLLKVLSKITYPTKGRIEINGRVSSLLEVGTGFHPELTGRQNVFLNGSILGMTKKEIQSKFDEIVDFSGVEKFIDTPVKHYSSGMKVRLAFSVAAHLEPEILIIDEVLAVGDAEFQKKCLGKMEDVAGDGRTVLFVSHNMLAVRKLCTSGILLNEGKIQKQADIEDILPLYLDDLSITSGGSEYFFDNSKQSSFLFTYFKIVPGHSNEVVMTGSNVSFEIFYEVNAQEQALTGFQISFDIRDQNDQKIVFASTRLDNIEVSDQVLRANKGIRLEFKELALKPGRYFLSLNCVQSKEFLARHDKFMSLNVVESTDFKYVSTPHSGVWVPPKEWEWIK